MTCDAMIRPFRPINETELACEHDYGHSPTTAHQAVLCDYAYPGSATTLTWNEADRRTFHVAWPGECTIEGCTLPRGHQGRHT